GPPLWDLDRETGRRTAERRAGFVAGLHDARGWDARFALLESAVAERLADARPVSEGVAWAWHQLERSAGNVAVSTLAAKLGCSRKHLIARFRDQVGLPPKLLGRILRFQRVLRRIEAAPALPRWVDVAADCGDFDQAHLIREFRGFSGSTPSDFLARLLPNGGGILG